MCDLLVDTRYLMVKVKSVHYTFISVSQEYSTHISEFNNKNSTHLVEFTFTKAAGWWFTRGHRHHNCFNGKLLKHIFLIFV